MSKVCWSHHNVSLWISNDEGLYSLAMDAIRHNRTREQAAEHMLDTLKECGCEATPDGAKYSKSSIRYAMVGL